MSSSLAANRSLLPSAHILVLGITYTKNEVPKIISNIMVCTKAKDVTGTIKDGSSYVFKFLFSITVL
jgi:hypothetical protein